MVKGETGKDPWSQGKWKRDVCLSGLRWILRQPGIVKVNTEIPTEHWAAQRLGLGCRDGGTPAPLQ